MPTLGSNTETHNLLLATLSERESAALQLQSVQLQQNQILIAPAEQIRHVYFITSGLVSTNIVMRSGHGVEVLLTGREGCVGFSGITSSEPAHTQTVVQMEGSALRVSIEFLSEMLSRHRSFNSLLYDYISTQFAEVLQLSGCNRLHAAEQRLARWLLMAGDRLRSKTFPATHESLGRIIGTKRETVTALAVKLERQGIIGYHRGTLQIHQRHLLERNACECYLVIRRLFERFATIKDVKK